MLLQNNVKNWTIVETDIGEVYLITEPLDDFLAFKDLWGAGMDDPCLDGVLYAGLAENLSLEDFDVLRRIASLPTLEARLERIKGTLQVLLDCVDYTAGACRPNEMVGAALPLSVVNLAREVLNA